MSWSTLTSSTTTCPCRNSLAKVEQQCFSGNGPYIQPLPQAIALTRCVSVQTEELPSHCRIHSSPAIQSSRSRRSLVGSSLSTFHPVLSARVWI